MTQIVALVGSLRAGSINRQLTEAAVQHAPEGIELSVFDGIVDLPFYNEDIDGDTPPAAAVAFRQAIADADGLLLVTPEYNGTMPAVLKNALDWASRPFGASPISGKPLASSVRPSASTAACGHTTTPARPPASRARRSWRTSRSRSRSPSSASPRRTRVRTTRSPASSAAR
jgi:NAD(P)H-dependent FMN reductase